MTLTPFFKKATFLLAPLIMVSGCTSFLQKRWEECHLKGIERNAFSWQKGNTLIRFKPKKNQAIIEIKIGAIHSKKNNQDGLSFLPCTKKKAERYKKKNLKEDKFNQDSLKKWDHLLLPKLNGE